MNILDYCGDFFRTEERLSNGFLSLYAHRGMATGAENGNEDAPTHAVLTEVSRQ